jgi:hypothetical protein
VVYATLVDGICRKCSNWNERPLVVLISVWLHHIPSIQDGKQATCIHTLLCSSRSHSGPVRLTGITAFDLVLVGWVPNAHGGYLMHMVVT